MILRLIEVGRPYRSFFLSSGRTRKSQAASAPSRASTNSEEDCSADTTEAQLESFERCSATGGWVDGADLCAEGLVERDDGAAGFARQLLQKLVAGLN